MHAPSNPPGAAIAGESIAKKPRKLNRPLATCTGCRRRRTRCDRLLPCSECTRRRTPCDYTGAVCPSFAATRSLNDSTERDQYILSLEKRIRELEHSRTSSTSENLALGNEESLVKDHEQHILLEESRLGRDYTTDDLACHIAQATVGRRVTTPPHAHHSLELQITQMIEAETKGPGSYNFSGPDAFSFSNHVTGIAKPMRSFEHWEEFRMDFNSKEGPQTLSAIIDILPTQAQLEATSEIFFHSLNSWLPAVHEAQWKIDIENFWAENKIDSLKSSPSYAELHFVACTLAIAGHGLLRLECSPNLFVTTEEERNWLANVWLKASLRTLVLADVFVKPTIYAIRALGLLSSVEVSAENWDHAVFFWSITTSLAGLVGLYREPPGLDAESVSEEELESRRHLVWYLLAFDWGGNVISGIVSQPVDPDSYAVKIPGEVQLQSLRYDPEDHWPLDPIISMRKAYAISNRVMQKITVSLYAGKSATYHDVLKLEELQNQAENKVPKRLQVIIRDNDTLDTVVEMDFLSKLYCYYSWSHFSAARVRLHRLFINPNLGITPSERTRHLRELAKASRRYLLIAKLFPHSLLMCPLVVFGSVHVGSAISVAVLTGPDACEVFDLKFFLPELHRLEETFRAGLNTMAGSLMRRAAATFKILINKIEEADYFRGHRFKKGPTTVASISMSGYNYEEDREPTRKKNQTTSALANSVVPRKPHDTEEEKSSLSRYDQMRQMLDLIPLFPRCRPARGNVALSNANVSPQSSTTISASIYSTSAYERFHDHDQFKINDQKLDCHSHRQSQVTSHDELANTIRPCPKLSMSFQDEPLIESGSPTPPHGALNQLISQHMFPLPNSTSETYGIEAGTSMTSPPLSSFLSVGLAGHQAFRQDRQIIPLPCRRSSISEAENLSMPGPSAATSLPQASRFTFHESNPFLSPNSYIPPSGIGSAFSGSRPEYPWTSSTFAYDDFQHSPKFKKPVPTQPKSNSHHFGHTDHAGPR